MLAWLTDTESSEDDLDETRETKENPNDAMAIISDAEQIQSELDQDMTMFANQMLSNEELLRNQPKTGTNARGGRNTDSRGMLATQPVSVTGGILSAIN